MALSDLVRDEPERPIELTLLVQTLSRLGPAELVEARRLIGEAFGAQAARERRQRIAVIGLAAPANPRSAPGLRRRAGFPSSSSTVRSSAPRHQPRRGLRPHRRPPIAAPTPGAGRDRRAPRPRRHRRRRRQSEPATLISCPVVLLHRLAQGGAEEHLARVTAQGDMRPMAASERQWRICAASSPGARRFMRAPT